MIHSGDCSQAAKDLHLQSNTHVLKTAVEGTFEGGSLTQDDMHVQTIKTGAYYLLAISALLTGTLLIPPEQERSKAHVITVSTLAALSGGLGAICLLAPNDTEVTAQSVSSSVTNFVIKAARTVATHASKWAPFAIAGTAAVCAASYYLYKKRNQPANYPTRKFKSLPTTALVPTAIIASLTPFAAPSLFSTMNSVAPKTPQQIP